MTLSLAPCLLSAAVSTASGRLSASVSPLHRGSVFRARMNGALSAFCRLPARAVRSAALRLQITAEMSGEKMPGGLSFGAISITGKGAYIDPAKCKECGRCAAACPYNAISDTMRPCIRACPVNAISKDDYNRASIDYSRCISCGACVVGCPFGAITDRSNIVAVIEALKSGEPVVATFAPAIEGHFGDANVGQLKAAIRKLGFTDVVEVSLGADARHGMKHRS